MYPPNMLEELNGDNRIYWPKNASAWPKLKRYLSEAKGVPLQDIIDDVYALQTMVELRVNASVTLPRNPKPYSNASSKRRPRGGCYS